MPYKLREDFNANRRLNYRVAREAAYKAEDLQPLGNAARANILCKECGKISRYSTQKAYRHYTECKHYVEAVPSAFPSDTKNAEYKRSVRSKELHRWGEENGFLVSGNYPSIKLTCIYCGYESARASKSTARRHYPDCVALEDNENSSN